MPPTTPEIGDDEHESGSDAFFQPVERQLPWPVSDNYLGRFKAAQEG